MSTHTFKMHLYQVQFHFQNEPSWYLADSACIGKDDPEWLYIGPREITVEVPGFSDMRDHKLEALREQERKVRAEFTARITEIQGQINNLLALEMS